MRRCPRWPHLLAIRLSPVRVRGKKAACQGIPFWHAGPPRTHCRPHGSGGTAALIYHKNIDPVAVRRYIGRVFQQPNPFAMSIHRNVAFGLKLNRYQGDIPAQVESALRGAALWDEVKDKLHKSGLSLSGGQQQRLGV